MIHTVKGFSIVNKGEIDVFLDISCFFHDQADVGHLISCSSAFSKTSLNIWKFMVHVLLKPGLEYFEHYFPSVWDECNCVVVWEFFGIACLLLYNLQLSTGLEHMPISIPFHWLVVGINPILHRGQPKGGNVKYKKGKPRGRRELLWVWPVTISWECLSNKRSVCLRWTEV